MDDTKVSKKLKKYEALLRGSNILVYEYHPNSDTAIRFNQELEEDDRISNYMSEIDKRVWIKPSERSKYVQFIRGMADGSIELDCVSPGNQQILNRINKIHMVDEDTKEEYFLLSKKDFTFQKNVEKKYREQALKDSMTQLYNRTSNKELIEDYLSHKTPYEACGMMVIDVDYFKGVNDSYGHLFGDKVLVSVACLLRLGALSSQETGAQQICIL